MLIYRYCKSPKEEYGRALTTVDLAIKNLPKKDKEYRSYAFALRADVYVRLEILIMLCVIMQLLLI